MMLRMVARLLRVLNSEADPLQISLALALSMVAGLTPIMSLHNAFVLFVALVLRVNLSAFILGLIFFTGVAYVLDPLFHVIGMGLLTAPSLEGLWSSMYGSAFWRIERFNNSIVMGSLVSALLLFVPLVIFLNLLIRKYRENIMAWVEKTHVMKAFKASRLYRLYSLYGGAGGGM